MIIAFLFSFLLQEAAEACSYKAASTVNEEYDDNLILLIRCGSPVPLQRELRPQNPPNSKSTYSHADNKNYQCVETLCR